LITGSHHILVMWWNHFSLLFSVHGVNYLRQAKIHRAQQIRPEVNAFEVEMVTETVRSHITRYWSNPSSIDKGTAVEQFTMRSINIFILFGIRRICWRKGRSQSFCLFIRRLIKQTVETIEAYHFCQLLTKFYPTPFYQGLLQMQSKFMRTTTVYLCATGQLVIIRVYYALIKYNRKKMRLQWSSVSAKLFIDFKKTCIWFS